MISARASLTIELIYYYVELIYYKVGDSVLQTGEVLQSDATLL